MTGKTVQHGDEQAAAARVRVAGGGGGGVSAADSAALGLAQSYERLREGLLQRLDALEALAADQTAPGGDAPSDRERSLRERAATLEASLSRLQAELRRREQDWEEKARQLDHDRRLLTEAWQRLEEEQVRNAGRDPEGPCPKPAPHHAAPPHAAPPDEAGEAVTRAILRQFQTLQEDVRRNAKGRSAH